MIDKGWNLVNELNKKSEDWLIDYQERLEESQPGSPVIQQIEEELDRRADIYNMKQEQIKEVERKFQEKRAALIAEFEALREENGERNIMLAMVKEFGDEYTDNYHIDSQYDVHSYAQDKEQSTWPCEDLATAKKKVNTLIYYRVYDKYFRDGPTDDILDRLKVQIIEMSNTSKIQRQEEAKAM